MAIASSTCAPAWSERRNMSTTSTCSPRAWSDGEASGQFGFTRSTRYPRDSIIAAIRLLSRNGSGDAPTTAQVRIASALRMASSTAAEGNVRRLRVALFITCFNDTLFPQTGRAVVRLLERLGHEVAFPEQQTCCGQMHFNTGYAREAVGLAQRFVRVFADEGADAIVTPSASCAAMVHHAYAERLGVKPPPVHELTEFLVDELGLDDVGAYFPHRVTYHPTCHGLRLLELGDRPLRLLRAVRGIDLVELPEARECCGFGGTFAVKNKDVSSAMLADKMRAVLDTEAEIVTAGDNSCLMHIGGGLSRQRAGVRPMHLAEILAHTEEDARP